MDPPGRVLGSWLAVQLAMASWASPTTEPEPAPKAAQTESAESTAKLD